MERAKSTRSSLVHSHTSFTLKDRLILHEQGSSVVVNKDKYSSSRDTEQFTSNLTGLNKKSPIRDLLAHFLPVDGFSPLSISWLVDLSARLRKNYGKDLHETWMEDGYNRPH